MYNWLNIIQECLLPPTCILCGHPGDGSRDLCRFCVEDLPKNENCCYRCAEPLEITASSDLLCGRCLSKPPAFDRTFAPFLYSGAIRHLIVELKFNAAYKNARVLGTLFADCLGDHYERPDLLLPVPLHGSRYRERGFNQSLEIAENLGKQLHIPLVADSCIRHRNTPRQSGLSAKKRRTNVKNAFSLQKPVSADYVAIIDDVMTTGSTAHELARLLKKNGVKRVDVWVCAKA